MKISIYFFLSMIIGLSGCSSQKKLETTVPFVVGSASCQEWVGGREESGKGQTIKIAISEMTGEKVTLQNIYFRDAMCKVDMVMEEEGMMATGIFRSGKPDIVMHSDATKEVGNQPPKLKSKEEREFPFELNKDEAVISYLEDEKIKYYKITGIKDKPALIYPGRPQN